METSSETVSENHLVERGLLGEKRYTGEKHKENRRDDKNVCTKRMPFDKTYESKPKKYSTQSKEKNMEENKWLRSYTVATWIIAALTIVIAGIGYLQYCMYRDGERPWLGGIGRTAFVNVTTGRVGYVEWHFKNGGRSPAKDIRSNLALIPGRAIVADHIEVRGPEVPECTASTPLPGDTGPVALPGVDNVLIAYSPQTVLDSSDSINTNKVGLYLVGCVDYRGASEQDYRTEVCEYYLASTKNFYTCPTGNNAR